MNCHEIEELLTPYLLKDLDAEKSEQMRAHLESCERCRALARDLESTLDLLGDALAAPSGAPAGLDAERVEKVRNADVRKPSILILVNWPMVARVAAIFLVTVFLILNEYNKQDVMRFITNQRASYSQILCYDYLFHSHSHSRWHSAHFSSSLRRCHRRSG